MPYLADKGHTPYLPYLAYSLISKKIIYLYSYNQLFEFHTEALLRQINFDKWFKSFTATSGVEPLLLRNQKKAA
jgi:hypothetical protein